MRNLLYHSIILLVVGMLCTQCNNEKTKDIERRVADSLHISDSVMKADYFTLCDSFGRFFVVPRFQDDVEMSVELKVFDSSANQICSVKMNLFDYADSIYQGRTENEIFVSSHGGSGYFGHLSKINLRKREVVKEIDLGYMAYKIERIPQGFKVFNGPPLYHEYEGDTVQIINFDGKLLRKYH